MNVIIVGYGKIGRIKAFIWQSLGREVSVYDVDAQKQNQAKSDGFMLYGDAQLYEDLIVDVSTPASFHLQSLEWTLEHIRPLPRSILIEKPLASDEAELKAIHRLLARNGMTDFKDKIIINESYYLSSALKFVAKDIAQRGLQVTGINAELSKNRLADVANGRFVDVHLGSLGIELPHMVAMLQGLGYNLAELEVRKIVIYQEGGTSHNEGFVADLSAGGTPITLKSFLGDFRVNGSSILSNLSTIRSLEVKTDLRGYHISFDPVEGLERYRARVTIFDHNTSSSEIEIINDDHLAANLKKIHDRTEDRTLDALLGVDNSLEISRFIFGLKRNARYHDIYTLVENQGPIVLQARPLAEGVRL